MPAPTRFEQFEVDSALLSEIGEKLVTTPHVALSELVKNAYDADATEVHVAITYDEDGMPIVEVVDDGHGMTRSAVHQYWMRIGTTNKGIDQESPKYHRRRTGAKGIGRFACRRLGRVLKLETTALLRKADRADPSEKYEHTELEFRWDEFKPGELVSSVKIAVRTKRTTKGSTGLRLLITGATNDEWSFRGFSYLKRQLAALCANQGGWRFGSLHEDPGFKVYLTAPGFQDDETADIRELLMEAGWGTLDAHVDARGHAMCTLEAKGLGKRTIRSTHSFQGLSDVHLRLAIFPQEREWLRDTTVVSKTSVSDLCSEWGGVQARFRGFRIYPYGDEQDDWLEIESDRARRLGKPTEDDLLDYAKVLGGLKPSRTLLNMLSMKNYFGSVEIGEQQQGLEPKADRMGFLENDVFRQLKKFVRYSIDWSVILRDYAIQLAESRRQRELRDRLQLEHGITTLTSDSPKESIAAMRNAIDDIEGRLPDAEKSKVVILRDITSYLESTLTVASRDLVRLRLVASASTLTLLFAHEIKSLASTFGSIAREIKDLLPNLPTKRRDRLKQLGLEVEEAQESLDELLELTHSMGTFERDPQTLRIDLRNAADRAAKRFNRISDRYTISIDTSDIPDGILVGPMLEGELMAILINILSNSVKAVIAGGRQRLISLRGEKRGNVNILELMDTGHGLSEEHFDDVFTPMISDPAGTLYDKLEERVNPEDTLLLGSGTGLGLSIVRGILEARNGKAELLKPSTGWSFHLKITLP